MGSIYTGFKYQDEDLSDLLESPDVLPNQLPDEINPWRSIIQPAYPEYTNNDQTLNFITKLEASDANFNILSIRPAYSAATSNFMRNGIYFDAAKKNSALFPNDTYELANDEKSIKTTVPVGKYIIKGTSQSGQKTGPITCTYKPNEKKIVSPGLNATLTVPALIIDLQGPGGAGSQGEAGILAKKHGGNGGQSGGFIRLYVKLPESGDDIEFTLHAGSCESSDQSYPTIFYPNATEDYSIRAAAGAAGGIDTSTPNADGKIYLKTPDDDYKTISPNSSVAKLSINNLDIYALTVIPGVDGGEGSSINAGQGSYGNELSSSLSYFDGISTPVYVAKGVGEIFDTQDLANGKYGGGGGGASIFGSSYWATSTGLDARAFGCGGPGQTSYLGMVEQWIAGGDGIIILHYR